MSALKRLLAAIGLKSPIPEMARSGVAIAQPGIAAGGKRHLWLAYGLPFVTTAATVLVLEAAGPDVPVKTPLIVFLFPIILSAYVGGLAPGLLATLLSTFASFYYVLPPSHTWRVSNPVDNLKWITLAGAGTLISFLMAHQGRPRPEPVGPHTPQTGSLLLSTERKVRTGFAVLLACLIAITAVSYPALVRLREDTARVDHTHQVIATLRLLISSTTDAETNVRGYFITGSEEFLEPYHSAMQGVDHALSEVRRLTKDEPEQQRRLDVLEPLVAERLAVLRGGIERRRQGFPLQQGSASRGRGAQLQDRIRSAVGEMEATEQARLATGEALEQRASVVAKIEIVGGSALAILIVALALWMIGRAFTASRDFEAALQESRDQLEVRVNERTLELRTSEHRLSVIISSAMDAVITVDDEQRIVLFNPAAEKLFDCAADEALGHPLERFIPQRCRSAHADHVLHFGQSKIPHKPMSVSGDMCGLRADGAEFPIEASLSQGELGGKKVFTVILRDISERKQAEERLRKREEENRLLADLLEGSAQPFGVGYADGRLGIVNEAFERLTGFSREELRVMNWAEALTPPEWREIERSKLEELQRTGQPVRYEKEYLRKDGSRVPIELLVHIRKNDEGGPAFYYSFLTDLTERKRTEEAVRTFVQQAPAAIAMLDVSMRYLVVSKRWLSDFKLGDRNVVGVSHYEVFPEIPERWKEAHRRCLAGAVESCTEDPFPRADGTVDWLRWEVRPWRKADDTIGGIIIFTEQITEGKQTEEALRRSDADLKEAQRIAQVGNWTYDLATDTVTQSEEVYRIFGRDPKLPKAKVAESAGLFTPESWERIRKAQQEAMQSGTPQQVDLEVVRADGTRRWIATIGEAERDASGQVVRLRGTVQDITDRKQAEEALVQRAQELARSNADLEEFAYVASHDLKEPLRAVSGSVGLLQRHYKGKLDDFASVCIVHAVDGTLRMESLIDGLLAYSRVGTRGGEFEAVNSAHALDTALQNLAATIQETGAVINHDALPAVYADEWQLVSLFQNLIGNSLKFRKQAPPRVHVSAERRDTKWRFFVRDNGIGIDPKFFGKIFRVFQRLHTRSQYPGTGVGLALCKKIVERHGGRIWVESVPGEGATFYFSLMDAQTNHPEQERELHDEGRDAV